MGCDPFVIPSNITKDWRNISKINKVDYDDWYNKLSNSANRNELKAIKGELNNVFENLLNQN